MADAAPAGRETLYEEASATFGGAMERLARVYEADPDKRRDLLQEIHLALWLSLERFDGRCSLRTWVYRVAHNTATSHTLRRRFRAPALVDLDDVSLAAQTDEREVVLDRQRALERLTTLLRTLKPADRQVMLLYLEGEDAGSIGEVTGLSPGNVATKVHRIKQLLIRRFHKRTCDAE
jgi:RNA polymerase sigma-70 factor (ECF subfamily)